MVNMHFRPVDKALLNRVVDKFVDYLDKNPKLESMVVGISGGIDSCVVAALARLACAGIYSRSARRVRLIGVSLPSSSNKKDEQTRATNTRLFCDGFYTFPINDEFDFFIKHSADPKAFESSIQKGNLKARIRMIHLYDIAQREKGMVLSTDNLTELMVGFWTLHGDVGDFAPIQELWKTEVFQLAEVLARVFETGGDSDMAKVLRETAVAVPTDGLGISNSDLDQLLPGWEGDAQTGYKRVDNTLLDILRGHVVSPDNPVVVRHLATEYKRNNPARISRSEIMS